MPTRNTVVACFIQQNKPGVYAYLKYCTVVSCFIQQNKPWVYAYLKSNQRCAFDNCYLIANIFYQNDFALYT